MRFLCLALAVLTASTAVSLPRAAAQGTARPPAVTPSMCTSQTYQTIAAPRATNDPTTSDRRTATSSPKPDEARSDIDPLSPIEAAFQVVMPAGQGLTEMVFDSPKPPPLVVAGNLPGQARVPEGPGASKSQPPVPTALYLGPFGRPLRQFGYAAFMSNVSTFAPLDDAPVGPDYILGSEDDLRITVWHPTQQTHVRLVDRTGRIVLPRIGDVRLAGLAFSQADRLLREKFARHFPRSQVSVTMGRLRTIRVQVTGEVCQPGSYTLTSLARLTHALYAAGGPTKLGSLHSVRLTRNGQAMDEIDVYDILLRADRSSDVRLESGDAIFVRTIGDVAAIAGEVKRPAIYELKKDVRLADLAAAAGGVTPTSYLKRVQIVRSVPGGERVNLDVDLNAYYASGDQTHNPSIQAGDLVLVHRSTDRFDKIVKLTGAVKYPGAFDLKPMMRLTALVPESMLLPESHRERVEIVRRRPDHRIEVLSANLTKAWAGDLLADPLLRPDDEGR